jgi:hypothetical protein
MVLDSRRKDKIQNGSDDGVEYSELVGFWTLSIVMYSRNHKTQ